MDVRISLPSTRRERSQEPVGDQQRALQRRVESWITDDPDRSCRDELSSLLEASRFDELAERFASDLSFGTAGIRGRLGAGPARMNRATVRRVTAGLARYLLDGVGDAAAVRVVVGRDARHGSAAFADEAAAVLTGAGIRTLRLADELPTPVLAFAVRHLGCAAGVMITASHNLPQDNGYKVYCADGAQIAPPIDSRIAARIERVGPLSEVPLGGPGEPADARVLDAYLDAIVAALPDGSAAKEPDAALRIIYTPLHGVSRDVLLAAFARAGLPAPHVLASQGEPDPDFPTLVSPNPEEPGTLDLALAEARRRGADLVLANDPDGDRLAVAIPGRGPDSWRVLAGDEIGALLGQHLLAQRAGPAHALVVSTIASSTLLARLAEAAGVRYAETLTGFKWIMRAGAGWEPAPRLRFGYEEALGFAVNDVVRDKDGISAALVMSQVAAEAHAEGVTLEQRLDDLARRFGLHATRQLSLALPGGRQQRLDEIMRALRERPPPRLGGHLVTSVDDLAAGVRRTAQAGEQKLDLPPADVLVLRCAGGTKVVIRPSGTEPKLKIYLQVVVEIGDGDAAEARRRAADGLDVLAAEMHTVLGT